MINQKEITSDEEILSLQIEKKHSHKEQIVLRVDFLSFIIQNSELNLGKEELDLLWFILGEKAVHYSDTLAFYKLFKLYTSTAQPPEIWESLVDFFQNKFILTSINYEPLTEESYIYLHNFFLLVNQYNNSVKLQIPNYFGTYYILLEVFICIWNYIYIYIYLGSDTTGETRIVERDRIILEDSNRGKQ